MIAINDRDVDLFKLSFQLHVFSATTGTFCVHAKMYWQTIGVCIETCTTDLTHQGCSQSRHTSMQGKDSNQIHQS